MREKLIKYLTKLKKIYVNPNLSIDNSIFNTDMEKEYKILKKETGIKLQLRVDEKFLQKYLNILKKRNKYREEQKLDSEALSISYR